MTDISLTKTVLKAGVWHGRASRLDGAEAPAPDLTAWHEARKVDGLDIARTKEAGIWDVRLTLGADLVSDGVQTVLIRDEASGEVVETLTFVAGEALDRDIRAEVSLLRAELDLLKRAFRRHCVETEA